MKIIFLFPLDASKVIWNLWFVSPDASGAIWYVCFCLMPPRLYGIYCLFSSDASMAIWHVCFCLTPPRLYGICVVCLA